MTNSSWRERVNVAEVLCDRARAEADAVLELYICDATSARIEALLETFARETVALEVHAGHPKFPRICGRCLFMRPAINMSQDDKLLE